MQCSLLSSLLTYFEPITQSSQALALSAAMAYVYAHRVSPEYGAVRILTLQPGNTNDDLYGELTEEMWVCASTPYFVALSYCWGTNVKDHTLHTPEGTISITSSLNQALRNIRDLNSPLYLWVDAVCINQDDAEEKESSVKYMGQVYARAQCVIVHLGEADEHQYRGFELLEAYTAMYSVANGFNDPAARQLALTINSSTDWEPLRAIYRRPWFRRAWVAQEFMHARELVFVLGKWRGPWEALWLPLTIGTERLPEGGTESISKSSVFSLVQTRDRSQAYLDFKRGYSLFFCLGHAKMDRKSGETTPPEVDDYDGLKIQMLFNALTAMRGREATDPRDNIYAFISLIYPQEVLPWLTNNLPISYSMSTTKVAVRYGYMMVERLHGDVLYSAGLSQQQRSPTEWPTWVPDWSAPNHSGHRFWCSNAAERGRYKASKDHKFSARLAENTGELIVKGSVVDGIKHVGTFDQWATFSNINDAMKAFFIDCIAVLNECSSPEIYEQAISKGVLGRVIMANSLLDGTEPPSTLFIAFSILISSLAFTLGREQIPERLRQIVEAEEFMKELDPLLKRVSINLQSRLLCVTENGHLGLAAYGTRPGDVVAILMGCNVPFILRNIKQEGSSGSTGPFWLIGEAYVHGIMDGKAVDGADFAPDELWIQ